MEAKYRNSPVFWRSSHFELCFDGGTQNGFEQTHPNRKNSQTQRRGGRRTFSDFGRNARKKWVYPL